MGGRFLGDGAKIELAKNIGKILGCKKRHMVLTNSFFAKKHDMESILTHFNV